MRSLWRSLCSVFLAFCIVFSNSLCALANTTTEQIYSFMPLAFPSSYNVSMFSGLYDLTNDSFTFNETDLGTKSNGDILGFDYQGIVTDFNYNFGLMPVLGFSIGSPSSSSSLSIPDGSSLSVSINNVYFNAFNYFDEIENFLKPSAAVPYRVIADMHFTATQQIGNTHSATYHDQTIDITNFLTSSKVKGNNSYFSDNYFDVNLNIPIVADTSGFTGDRLYNINLRYIKFYAVYDFSQYYDIFGVSFSSDISPGSHLRIFSVLRNLGTNDMVSSRIYVNYSDVGVSESSSVSNSINSSISSLSNNVSTQINQVKTQITQSTNTITTKIDRMSQDIQTGLQNVVTSAQQNTQNIINTVTNKVDEVKTGITEVKDSIIDLPNKLQDMLVGFFVPDEETINSKFAEFETLLSDRFGLIYQSADIIHDFADSLQTQAVMVADTGGVITLPSVTVNLAGVDYTFGGFDVDVIPNGFEALQTAVRLATSMVCTVVFVNMLKNKLEAILK